MSILLEADHISRRFQTNQSGFFKKRYVHAVRDVSFKVTAGQTMGLVGESGCGKSTLARLLLGLDRPDRGEIRFEGKPLRGLTGESLKAFKRSVQVVFQDPLSSLNPRMQIYRILSEPFTIHHRYSREATTNRVSDLMQKVGLHPSMLSRYPHELSGGERQRVCVARAIALKPKVVICDEAVSSLDVLVQAQILNLLLKLQKEEQLAYVFISHDLAIVRHMSDSIAVMKDGAIVESGSLEQVLNAPRAEYTRTLIAASQIQL